MQKPLSKRLNLFFPQWQGASRIELYKGAQLLYKFLSDEFDFIQVPVSSTYSLASDKNILGYFQILNQFLAANRILHSENPAKIFTLGGDCGIEIAPISFLNKRYDSSLSIIWLDAHGDLNTPISSPSHHFHGMPLRLLLGEGDRTILSHRFSSLSASQIFLVGLRELDSPEQEFIRHNRLAVFPPREINSGNYERLISRLEKVGSNKLYVHLDLDVISPQEFPYVACPSPGGVRLDRLQNLLIRLSKRFDIVGFSILEFLPCGRQKEAASKVISLLKGANLLSLSTV
ncbi:MAG: arginase family protein [Cyanobacteria bacterium P01_C01_bin.70]